MSIDHPPPSYVAPALRGAVFFDRLELHALMQLYGRMVAAGEWRDYAISGLSDCAVFCVFRRAAEAPLYRFEKRPALARRQGAWAIFGQGGQMLRRGHDLSQVMRLFDARRFRVVD